MIDLNMIKANNFEQVQEILHAHYTYTDAMHLAEYIGQDYKVKQ